MHIFPNLLHDSNITGSFKTKRHHDLDNNYTVTNQCVRSHTFLRVLCVFTAVSYTTYFSPTYIYCMHWVQNVTVPTLNIYIHIITSQLYLSYWTAPIQAFVIRCVLKLVETETIDSPLTWMEHDAMWSDTVWASTLTFNVSVWLFEENDYVTSFMFPVEHFINSQQLFGAVAALWDKYQSKCSVHKMS